MGRYLLVKTEIMSILSNKNRIGRFTSSEIYLLTKNGRNKSDMFSVSAQTYIKKKSYERILGRSVSIEKYSRSIAWGHFLEMYVFSLLGLEYKIEADNTVALNDYWAGSADLIVPGVKIGDIKCYEPFNFADYSLMLISQDLDRFKKEFEQEYWQLVSNAIVNNVKTVEAIVFMPTIDQLAEIQEMARNYEGKDLWKYRFIVESEPEDLPYIPNEAKLESMNTWEFEVPQEDKAYLIERVELANVELLKLLK